MYGEENAPILAAPVDVPIPMFLIKQIFSNDDNMVLKQLLEQRSLKELARKVTLSSWRGHNSEQMDKKK